MATDGRTHYEGCWKQLGHRDCAERKVAELDRKLASLDKWISVKERLPEDGVEVLAYHADLALLDEGFRARFVGWLDYDDSPPTWIRDGEQIVGVTHWQPLPNPPSHPKGDEVAAHERESK